MLRVDLSGLSDLELKEILTKQCSRCGSVKQVKIYRSSDPQEYTLAFVDMSTEAEVNNVVEEFGGVRFGSSAVIQLAPLPK